MVKILLIIGIVLSLHATNNQVDNAGLDLVNSQVKSSNYDQHKLKAPMQNLFASTQWDLFLREFEMKMDLGVCCNKGDIMTCAVGVKAHMIEPIGYMETTQKPLVFPFAKLDMGGNVLKGNSLMEVMEEMDGGRSVAADAHFIYIPIMGIIFKKKLKFVCFHEGDLLIPYMSEFDPTWKQDLYAAKMIPHMIQMFTPQALISSIFDCVACEIANGVMGYQDGATIDLNAQSLESTSGQDDLIGESNQMGDMEKATLEKMNQIRNTFYFVDGCNGFTPVGGYVQGDDVIADATLTFHGIMAMLHSMSALSPIPFLYKQSNVSITPSEFPRSVTESGGLDTMCRWEDYALPIPSQYLLQLAYPTIGSAKELGVSGLNVSTAKNVPEAVNASAFTVWVRRDYYAFAYFCSKSKAGVGE